MAAASLCRESTVALLLKRGADPNLDAYDRPPGASSSTIRTALDIARLNECSKSLQQILISAGAKTWNQVVEDSKKKKLGR